MPRILYRECPDGNHGINGAQILQTFPQAPTRQLSSVLMLFNQPSPSSVCSAFSVGNTVLVEVQPKCYRVGARGLPARQSTAH